MNAQTNSEHCPLCQADALERHTRARDFDQDGVQFHVEGLEHSECRECGAITTLPEQSRRNKRLIIAAQRKASGLLTGEEIAALRKYRLGGVTQGVMASVLNVGVNTFSRYETDSVVQSDAMNSLLVVLDAHPEAFQTLAKRRGVMIEPVRTPILAPAALTARPSSIGIFVDILHKHYAESLRTTEFTLPAASAIEIAPRLTGRQDDFTAKVACG